MNDGMDYEVATKVNFRLDVDGSGEMNQLSLPAVHGAFVNHVKEVYEQDETLSGYITGNLDFQFNGYNVTLRYTFICSDENEAEAESFSEYCIRKVQKKLESFGCRVRAIRCNAAEADPMWLDRLDDAVFGPKRQSSHEHDSR